MTEKDAIELFVREQTLGMTDKVEQGKCPGHDVGPGGYGSVPCKLTPTVTLTHRKTGRRVQWCRLCAVTMQHPINGWVEVPTPKE